MGEKTENETEKTENETKKQKMKLKNRKFEKIIFYPYNKFHFVFFGCYMSEISNYLVKKSNKLISASYSLTVNEQRLLLACLSKVDSRKKLYASDLFVVTVQQMQELFYTEENEKNVYRDLKEAAEKLLERKVRIDEPNSIAGYTIANFVQAAKFEPDLMQVSMRFTYDLSPYLSELKEKFTEYRLGHIAQLTSSYAIRIYEMIVSWFGRDGQHRENKIEISKLRQILDVKNKYSQFGQLRQFVLAPAIQQINENTDFTVSFELQKRGRTYHWITFKFEQKQNIKDIENQRKAERKAIADRNRAAKIKREQAEQEAAAKQAALEARQAQELVEQEKRAAEQSQHEQENKKAVEIWEYLSDEKRAEVQQTALQNVYSALQPSLIKAFEQNNLSELLGRFRKSFIEALKPFEPSQMLQLSDLPVQETPSEYAQRKQGKATITFSDEYIKNFEKQLIMYRDFREMMNEDAIIDIETAMRFFKISLDDLDDL